MNTQEKYPEFIQHAIACSPFIQRLLMSDERLLAELQSEIEQPYLVSDMRAYLSTHEINDEVSLKRSLRKLRQRVMLRVITRDLNGKAGLQEVMQGRQPSSRQLNSELMVRASTQRK